MAGLFAEQVLLDDDSGRVEYIPGLLERDSVAPHNDHLHEIAEGQPIALVSLGATREMVIRARTPPRRLLRIDLEAGSLLLMSHATQLHYDHGIPKQKHAAGPRISLAFRVKRAVGRY